MNQNKLIVIDDAVPYAKEMFSHLGEIKLLPGKSITPADCKNADALIVRSRTQVNANLLADSKVKFVGSTVVGLDHIDQTWLKKQQIQFYSAQGCNANSVAEFVITALLQLAEKLQFQLSEKTLAIIGVGHVGKLVQQKAAALGMTLLLNDPPRAKKEGNTEFVDLDTALKADIITLHTPLTKEGEYPTYHLISQAHLNRLAPETIIVNAARGGIIDEAAWIKTNTKANIIDCWEEEPNINKALYKVADLATPHIAGHSLDAKVAGSQMVYQALCQFWNTQPINTWQTHLPKKPDPIEIQQTNLSDQSFLQQITTLAHDPKKDDSELRSNEFYEVIQKFEYYRRHYPIYREWQQQTLKNPPKNLVSTLKKLGFSTE